MATPEDRGARIQSKQEHEPRIFYVNGKYKPDLKASISISDFSITRGWGVFTTIRAYNGHLFMLNEHIQRLQNSSLLVGIGFHWREPELEEIISNVYKLNKIKDGYLKVIITAGPEMQGINLESIYPSLLILVYPRKVFPQHVYQNGIGIITFPFERYLPEAKTINYIGSIMANREAKKRGAFDALFYNSSGFVSECTTSNFFGVRGGKIYTPKSNILKGITRDVIINLAMEEDLTVVETDVSTKEISNFDESFITGTLYEVIPIVKIDGFVVGKGKIGSITERMMKKFHAFVDS